MSISAIWLFQAGRLHNSNICVVNAGNYRR